MKKEPSNFLESYSDNEFKQLLKNVLIEFLEDALSNKKSLKLGLLNELLKNAFHRRLEHECARLLRKEKRLQRAVLRHFYRQYFDEIKAAVHELDMDWAAIEKTYDVAYIKQKDSESKQFYKFGFKVFVLQKVSSSFKVEPDMYNMMGAGWHSLVFAYGEDKIRAMDGDKLIVDSLERLMIMDQFFENYIKQTKELVKQRKSGEIKVPKQRSTHVKRAKRG